jgi:hypothetical protein
MLDDGEKVMGKKARMIKTNRKKECRWVDNIKMNLRDTMEGEGGLLTGLV